MSVVNGHCDPQFEAVSQLLHEYLSSGEELGASLAVNINGKDVIDIWGGHTDSEKSQVWNRDTITNVMSCSKLVTNLAALILIDRGILDVNEKVSTYWPEFAAQGKDEIEIRHILSHTAGLPGWDDTMALEDLYDWDKATSALAKQASWWKPGTQSGYHAITQGFLVGEVVRRTTGKTLKEFVRTEITEPLDADFQYGVQDQDLQRVSDVVPFSLPADMPAPDLSSIPGRVLTNPAIDFKYANSERWRKAAIYAAIQ
jgi:CubicO group peptidase (beta-lactamase class C family)